MKVNYRSIIMSLLKQQVSTRINSISIIIQPEHMTHKIYKSELLIMNPSSITPNSILPQSLSFVYFLQHASQQ